MKTPIRQAGSFITTSGYGLFVVMILSMSGCDTSINPIADSDRYFSIYGYLYAERDTHWIRIEDLRDGVPRSAPAAIMANVSIENLDNGETTQFRDSAFVHPPGGAVAHDFWAVRKVKAGERYRIRVQDTGGNTTEATTVLPSLIADPEFRDIPQIYHTICPPFYDPPPVTIRFPGVDRMVDVQAIYTIQDSTIVVKNIPHWRDTRRRNEAYELALAWDDDVGACSRILSLQVFVAVGGADWPDYQTLDSELLAMYDLTSNVRNGVGFFGGVISRVFDVPLGKIQ